MKSDALQVAKRAELRTVDAKQTVFGQGFVCLDFFVNSFLIHLIPFAKNYQCTECQCSHSKPLAGETGNEFYFVLQGSVAIQVGTKIVKVC